MDCRPRARSVRHCHGVLALREGPLTGAVQDESQLQEDASKLAAGNAGGQAIRRFEAEANFYSVQKATFCTMDCRPRARSARHCHGVSALREEASAEWFGGFKVNWGFHLLIVSLVGEDYSRHVSPQFRGHFL